MNKVEPKIIVRLLIARSQIELANYDDSIETLNEIKDPDSDYLFLKHFLLGFCYHKLDLFDNAEKEYKRVIDLKVSFTDVYYNLGVLYKNLDNLILSKRYFQICINLNKGHSLAQIALKELDKSMNWFSWWFNDPEKQNPRKALGLSLLGSFFAIVYSILLLNNDNINLTIILGIIVFLLILPNIKNISYGENKLEIHPFLNDQVSSSWDPFISINLFENLKNMLESSLTLQDVNSDTSRRFMIEK